MSLRLYVYVCLCLRVHVFVWFVCVSIFPCEYICVCGYLCPLLWSDLHLCVSVYACVVCDVNLCVHVCMCLCALCIVWIDVYRCVCIIMCTWLCFCVWVCGSVLCGCMCTCVCMHAWWGLGGEQSYQHSVLHIVQIGKCWPLWWGRVASQAQSLASRVETGYQPPLALCLGKRTIWQGRGAFWKVQKFIQSLLCSVGTLKTTQTNAL